MTVTRIGKSTRSPAKKMRAIRAKREPPSIVYPNQRPSVTARLAERSGDVAPVDRLDMTGGLARFGERDKGLGHILGEHLTIEQIAAHIFRLGHAARFGPCGDHGVGQQPAPDAVGIDAVRANAVGAVVDSILAHEQHGRRLRKAVRPEFAPGFTACFDRLNRSAPPVPCFSMMRTASCATVWWAKKLSSNVLRNSSSETSPMRPCHAAPAFDTTISTLPKRSQVAANAALTCSGLVTSHCMPSPLTSAAALIAASPSISRIAMGGPSAASARAVVAPIAPAPVTNATCPVRGLTTAPLSFACSRLQYSSANRSLSGRGS